MTILLTDRDLRKRCTDPTSVYNFRLPSEIIDTASNIIYADDNKIIVLKEKHKDNIFLTATIKMIEDLQQLVKQININKSI